jgi:FMN phosphatase YigB (HAD superfamily)
MKIALFDLDNTLFDRTGNYRTWVTRYVESVGIEPGEVEWLCDADEDGFADRRIVWAKAKERFNLPETVDELVASYRASCLDACQPSDEVLKCLELLREGGWSLGIVTNGVMPHQAEKADRLGLLALVDAFCGSGELGIEKPDRRIFDEAIRRCAGTNGRHENTSWMVGDAPIPDIIGGRAAGLRTIWLDRGRKWNPRDGDPPDVTVSSLTEAVQVILSEKI